MQSARVAIVATTLLAGCPSPQMPKGPPPEYEEPPPPSWLDAGAEAAPPAAPAAAPADAGTTSIEPSPSPDGGG